MSRLQEIVALLRAPGGCPWDREQTHESLRAALLEESYEAVEAIVRGDDENLKEELGDLLLLVLMHSRIAEERGAFSFSDVEEMECEKMVRRHPHVFGEKEVVDSEGVLRQWEEIKRGEKGGGSQVMSGIPEALPALMKAQITQKKAAKVGFDWADDGGIEGPLEKMGEELRELQEAVRLGDARAVEEEMGDILFSAVNLARKLKVDAEVSLAGATGKFLRRFRAMEEEARVSGRGLDGMGPEELDALWESAKRGEER